MIRIEVPECFTKQTTLPERVYEDLKWLGAALACVGVGALFFLMLSLSDEEHGPNLNALSTGIGAVTGSMSGGLLLDVKYNLRKSTTPG